MGRQVGSVTKVRLDEISTEWAIIRDPPSFVLRYAPAIQRHFYSLIKNRHDAEEVAQDFFLRVAQHCFVHSRCPSNTGIRLASGLAK